MAFISQSDLYAYIQTASTPTKIAANQTAKFSENQTAEQSTSKNTLNASITSNASTSITSNPSDPSISKGNIESSNAKKNDNVPESKSDVSDSAKKNIEDASAQKTDSPPQSKPDVSDSAKKNIEDANTPKNDNSLQLKPDASNSTQENIENSNTPKTDNPPKSKSDFIDAAPEIQRIVNRGTIRIGMCTIDQPPFHVKGRNGEFVGFDIELAHDIAAALGVEIEIAEGADWDKLVELMLQDKIDLILSNLSLTETRASKILCSIPYAKIRQCILLNRVLLARASSRGLITLRQVFSEFDQRNFLIQEGTAYVTSATSMFPKAKITTTESWDEILDKLLSRQVVATISDEIEIKKRLRSVQAMELMPVILKGKYDLMVIGVSRNAPQLLHFINAYIECNNIECNVEDF